LIVAYHPPIFGGLKRLTPDRPLTRVLLQAVHDQVALYSPHTALDAVVGGVNDWLLEGLGEAAEVQPITPASDPDAPPGTGLGRLARLATPLDAAALVPRLKTWLGLASFRVAWAAAHRAGQPMARVAVCPGAGRSLFENMRAPVDLIVTGELRHHEILAYVAAGTTVVVTDHTNTERGFLPRYAEWIAGALPGVKVTISAVDADPLQVV
ncbi:MAG: Nif3-like dinuclear metal center hexameric protein, partial [Myxococcales bacterium]|nr:Nif3-like dinuclear metal center hexameric protein [Myxococcales bacterium]